MTQDKLSALYEDIKSSRGLEMPLKEFQDAYACIKPNALRGNPLHSTVHISIFGLGFEFPEKYLTDDITVAVEMALREDEELKAWRSKSEAVRTAAKPKIGKTVRHLKFYSRMAVLSCFNVVEAYFNSIAWEFLQGQNAGEGLSNRSRSFLEDTGRVSLGEKVLKYPELICGRSIFKRNEEPFKSFMDIVKPYRDSLVHPSPFLAPERFGGYDKLRTLYRIDVETALLAAQLTSELIGLTHRNVANNGELYPHWMEELLKLLENTQASRPRG